MERPSLQKLRLENFRNIAALELEFHPAFNFFLGENAQGKTALLEAIFFLSELRSFRTQDLTSLIRHRCEGASIFGWAQTDGLNYDLKIRLSPSEKEVWVNGKTPRPYRRLRRVLPLVLFTPESVRLFRGPPGDRRHYFDHSFSLLSEPFSKEVEEYNRTLKQKKELLDQIRAGNSARRSEKEIWDEKLAEGGARLATERLRFTEEIAPFFKTHFDRLSGGDWTAELLYHPHLPGVKGASSFEACRQLYREEIRRRGGEEIERNQVLVGPHRDDWEIVLGGERLKEEGSQGQHRIAVAALKLAELDGIRAQGMKPLALFDDLLSELDERRNRWVLEELANSPCQVFLTSVTPVGISLDGLKGLTFQILGGKVVK